MNICLDHDIEAAVNRRIQTGHFASAQELVDIAIKQFLIALEFGEEEARKLAILRAELQLADEQIDRGECSEYDEHTLNELFEEIEREGLMRLANERGNTE